MKTFSRALLVGTLLMAGATQPALPSPPTPTGETTFSSGSTPTPLLELYTSEGCSSCPPAEAWLSQLRTDSRLWREVVPVAFHVDYWDSLGWKDSFAAHAYTQRQNQYAARWRSSSVYTPAFVLNGREWSHGGELAPSPADQQNAGVLTVTFQSAPRTALVRYRPARSPDAAREVHVALLGCGLHQAVKAGENRGRDLTHDFVALGVVDGTLSKDKDSAGLLGVTLSLPAASPVAPTAGERFALAAWVSSTGSLGSEQATGGWLP